MDDPTGNFLNALISDRNTDGLKDALTTTRKTSLKQLNQILAIALEDMDHTLVGLAVMKGAHTNHLKILDGKFSDAALRTQLLILLYLACANFHRKKQQTFNFTSKIMDRIQSLSRKQDGKRSMNEVNVKNFCEDQFVVVIDRSGQQKKHLIEWALDAEDYFAVGQLMNMRLSVQVPQQQDPILRLVLQNKYEELQNKYEELQSSVSNMNLEIQNKIATGHACTEAVRVAIGNYSNKEVMRALNVTALAIATYLLRNKFDIVRQILSVFSDEIEHINANLAVPLRATETQSCNIATLVGELSSKISTYNENTQNTIRQIRSQLEKKHKLQIQVPDK